MMIEEQTDGQDEKKTILPISAFFHACVRRVAPCPVSRVSDLKARLTFHIFM